MPEGKAASNDGKSEAIAQLRREVGYGCPKCRSPFLTWHHFDPPVHKEGMHWRSEGIVALCPLCHADADEKGDTAGAYSKEELRAMKSSGRSLDEVKGHFPTWEDKEAVLIRMGGVYAGTGSPLFSINQVPQILVGKNEANVLSLSFELRNRDDQVLLRMDENWLTAYPKDIHDMIVTPKTKEVKVWLGKEDVGLELSFRRVTVAELERILREDRLRAQKIFEARMQQEIAQMPAEHRAFFEESMRETRTRPTTFPGIEEMPEHLRRIALSDDPVGEQVKLWAEKRCKMDDGLIPLLNFEQMAIYHHGQRFTIKDGVAGFLYYCAAFDSQAGAINITCPCNRCSPKRPA